MPHRSMVGKKANKGALPHLKDVYLWELCTFIEWSIAVLGVLRKLRTDFTNVGDLEWREKAKRTFIENDISPKSLAKKIKEIVAYKYFLEKGSS